MAVTTFEQYQAPETKPRDSSQSDDSSKFDLDVNFTATGQPMPTYKPSAWANACLWGEQAPNHPPFRYTDRSIIHVVVPVDTSAMNDEKAKRVTSRFERLKKVYRSSKEKSSNVKVVRMPRADYLRYFARDFDNNYVGTEPEMRWSEELLNEKFGMYQGLPPPHWVLVQSDGLVYMKEEETEKEPGGLLDEKRAVNIFHTAL